jgi:hypothetical protein
MENVLLLITGISVALTTGLAVALARVAGDERRRSEARVALLRDLSAQSSRPDRPAVARQVAARPAPAAVEPIRRPSPPAAPASVRAAVPDLELRPSGGAASVAGVGEMFHAPESESPWRTRAVAIAAMAAIVLMAVAVGRWRAPAAPRSGAPAASTAPAATATPRPLELMSLNHTRHEDTLTISGVVQNPRGAAPLVHVTATALVLGPGGKFLTSARAPLDFSTVGPGEESPFVITVPVGGDVERYRIAFRSEDGQVLAHVDRRGPEAVARK